MALCQLTNFFTEAFRNGCTLSNQPTDSLSHSPEKCGRLENPVMSPQGQEGQLIVLLVPSCNAHAEATRRTCVHPTHSEAHGRLHTLAFFPLIPSSAKVSAGSTRTLLREEARSPKRYASVSA